MKKEKNTFFKEDTALSKRITLYIIEFFQYLIIMIVSVWFVMSLLLTSKSFSYWTKNWIIFCIIILFFYLALRLVKREVEKWIQG